MSCLTYPIHLLHENLVLRPSISTFEWSPNKTLASSFSLLFAAIFSYLSLTLLFLLRLLPIPSIPPSFLRVVSILHNLFLLLLSLTISIAAALSASSQMPSLSWLLCFPPSTSPSGPIFFWAHIFYLSKIYELLDTALILLSPRRKPLSFLHVYHHSLVVPMAYLWLYTCQSLLPVALVVNAAVHVVMYAYFLSASLGWRWGTTWKRFVTRIQIAQFVFSFVASGGFLWINFRGGGCQGINGWLFNAVFNVSLLLLFFDFYSLAYGKKEKKMKNKKKKKKGV